MFGENNQQLRNGYLEKLFFKKASEIKTFANKQNLRVFYPEIITKGTARICNLGRRKMIPEVWSKMLERMVN